MAILLESWSTNGKPFSLLLVQLALLLSILLGAFSKEGSALVLPTQTTTTTTPAPAPSTDVASEPEEEQVYTTKRSAHLYFDLPVVTRFPMPLVNSEIQQQQKGGGGGGGGTAKMPEVAAAKVASATTKRTTSTSTSTEPPRRGPSELPLYRVNGSNGKACILLQVDALITIKYKTKLGEEQEADIYVPNGATVTGNCDEENYVLMSLKWDAFVLTWYFAKTPGGERWYVDKIQLTFNSSDRHFEHIDQPHKTIKLSTAHRHPSMLFPTPVGKSFSCDDEQEIPLSDNKYQASILLRNMKLQPFKFKNNDFATEFSCAALSARSGRDETAPLMVGSTLALAVLLTISGYAGWRHFKIKKVQYDTME